MYIVYLLWPNGGSSIGPAPYYPGDTEIADLIKTMQLSESAWIVPGTVGVDD